MHKIDHLVVNIDEKYQCSNEFINSISDAGYPYKPTWGKGTKGFKVSNIWIGEEYFEMVRLLKKDGGGWVPDWVEKYNQGHRGLICLIIDTNDLDKDYERLTQVGLDVTVPKFLKFKWFFNLITRTMPWRNSYISFFEGVPLQISIQQMKDEKSREFMRKYMSPNSIENKIKGIKAIIIYGMFTENDRVKIKTIFERVEENDDEIIVELSKNQRIIFKNDIGYHVEVFTSCENKKLASKEVRIENVTIRNSYIGD